MNVNSSYSKESALENTDPTLTVEDEPDIESISSVTKDSTHKDTTERVLTASLPSSEDQGSSAMSISQSSVRLPPSIASLVAAKAAIAAQSTTPSDNPSSSSAPVAEQQRWLSSLAKRQSRREHVIAASSNVETPPLLSNTTNEDATPQFVHHDDNARPEEGLLLSSIPAEIVIESAFATDRERFIQEVRAHVAAELVPADLVQVSHYPNNVTSQLPRRPLWYRYCAASFILIVIGTAVGVIVSRSRNRSSKLPGVGTTMTPIGAPSSDAPSAAPSLILPNGKHAFTATAQLYDAVDAYEAELVSNGAAEGSDVAEMYGYPMGTWDVSRLSDFREYSVKIPLKGWTLLLPSMDSSHLTKI
jgi:hypothetical protein